MPKLKLSSVCFNSDIEIKLNDEVHTLFVNSSRNEDSKLSCCDLFLKYQDIIGKSDYEKFLKNRHTQVKSAETSEIWMHKARDLFQAKQFAKALEYFNLSLAYAPPCSNVYSTVVGERALDLFELQKYKECLVDIHTALNYGFLEESIYKLYICQAKCNIELRKYVEAVESFEKAVAYFNRIKTTLTNSRHASINRSLRNIQIQLDAVYDSALSNNAVYDMNIYEIPALKDGESEELMCASNAVGVESHSRFKNQIVAKTNISKGDVLFVEKPLVLVTKSTPYCYCARCLKYLWNFVPCLYCTKTFYCSEKCRSSAWNKNHRWECIGIMKSLLSEHLLLVIRILIEEINNDFRPDDNVNHFAFFLDLLDDPCLLRQDVYQRSIFTSSFLTRYLMDSTDFFHWLLSHPNCSISLNQLHVFIGASILKYIFQIELNSENIYRGYLSDISSGFSSFSIQYLEIGIGIYPCSAKMNHSCDSNTINKFYNGTKITMALKDIEEGEVITTAYMNAHYLQMHKNERQALLYENYGFKCDCRACLSQEKEHVRIEISSAWKCIKCQGPVLEYYNNSAICLDCQTTFPSSAETLNNKNNIARSLMECASTTDIDSLDKTYSAMEKTFYKYHLAIYEAQIHYANIYHLSYNLQKCIEYLEKAVEIYANIFGAFTPNFLQNLINLAAMYTKYCVQLKAEKSPNLQHTRLKGLKVIQDLLDGINFIIPEIELSKVSRLKKLLVEI